MIRLDEAECERRGFHPLRKKRECAGLTVGVTMNKGWMESGGMMLEDSTPEKRWILADSSKQADEWMEVTLHRGDLGRHRGVR